MGLGSIFASKEDGARPGDTLAGPGSNPNMFVMLGRDVETVGESSGVAGVGLGTGYTPEFQPRKLKLLPRRKPVKAEDEVNAGPAGHLTGDGGDDASPDMSEAEANNKISGDVKKFFANPDIDESEDYFVSLPSEHHPRLVEEMVSKAVTSEEINGKLVAGAFSRAVEKKLCCISAFEEGFLLVAELLDYVVVDIPDAIQTMATMMKGAGLDKDEERRTRIAQKSIESEKLLELLV